MVPTITTLLKLAGALNRPVGYFVDEDAEATGPAVFIPAGDRRVVFTSHRGIELGGISGPYGLTRTGSGLRCRPGGAGHHRGRATSGSDPPGRRALAPYPWAVSLSPDLGPAPRSPLDPAASVAPEAPRRPGDPLSLHPRGEILMRARAAPTTREGTTGRPTAPT
jgi:hypothetical protein